MGKKEINAQGFRGYVVLKDYVLCPNAKNFMAIAGNIFVLSNKDLVGWDATNREANFVVRVESSDGSQSMNIFGCQIKAVYQGNFDNTNVDFFEVKNG